MIRLLISALVATLLTFAAPAQATRSSSSECVTTARYDRIKLNPAITRNEAESIMGVTAAGRTVITSKVSNIGTRDAFMYRPCGKTLDQEEILVLTERTSRPGYTPVPPGRRIVVSMVWWILAEGDTCGSYCEARAS